MAEVVISNGVMGDDENVTCGTGGREVRYFATEAEAKRFFIDRVVAQASSECISLSAAEQHMLAWSESDPSFQPVPELVDEFDRRYDEREFETKIADLLWRTYQHDVRQRPTAKAMYREAYAKLREGDHYLLVMIDRALGIRLKRWWPF